MQIVECHYPAIARTVETLVECELVVGTTHRNRVIAAGFTDVWFSSYRRHTDVVTAIPVRRLRPCTATV